MPLCSMTVISVNSYAQVRIEMLSVDSATVRRKTEGLTLTVEGRLTPLRTDRTEMDPPTTERLASLVCLLQQRGLLICRS
jgi:hypothetical protein